MAPWIRGPGRPASVRGIMDGRRHACRRGMHPQRARVRESGAAVRLQGAPTRPTLTAPAPGAAATRGLDPRIVRRPPKTGRWGRPRLAGTPPQQNWCGGPDGREGGRGRGGRRRRETASCAACLPSPAADLAAGRRDALSAADGAPRGRGRTDRTRAKTAPCGTPARGRLPRRHRPTARSGGRKRAGLASEWRLAGELPRMARECPATPCDPRRRVARPAGAVRTQARPCAPPPWRRVSGGGDSAVGVQCQPLTCRAVLLAGVRGRGFGHPDPPAPPSLPSAGHHAHGGRGCSGWHPLCLSGPW